MPPLYVWIALPLVTASIYGRVALVDVESQTRFDLICSVKGDADVKPWTVHYRIDLSRNAFCSDTYCGTFTQQDGPRLIYRCAPKPGEKLCKPFPKSTAGPFTKSDDLVFDRSTNSIHRTFSGWTGDRAAHEFDGSYSGRCMISQFTGLGEVE
jgi:hypothetical protein